MIRLAVVAALLLMVCGLPSAALAEATTATQLSWTGSTMYGAGGALAADVTSGGASVSEGSVTFYAGDTAVATVTVYAGRAYLSPTIYSPPAGAWTFRADYGGTANFAASSSSLPVTITRADSTVGMRFPSPFYAFQEGAVTADAAPKASSFYGTFRPAGALHVRVDGVDFASSPGSGDASVAVSASGSSRTIAGGDHTYSISFDGDANFLPTSSSGSFTVGRYPITVTIGSSAGGSSFSCPPGSSTPFPTCAPGVVEGGDVDVIVGEYVSPSFCCVPSGLQPSGAVQFFEDNDLLGSAPMVGGTARFTVHGLTAGVHWFHAVFVGDTAFAPATTGSLPLNVAHVRRGYWMVGSTGDVYSFGEASQLGGVATSDVVDLEPSPTGNGYWIVNGRGRVWSFGDAADHGGSPGLAAGERVTSLSRTRDGGGYWLFTSFGRVFAYGNAPWLGDMAGVRLNGAVLDSIPTPSGNGYYMVASDGGIFTFGDAIFQGSMGDVPLNQPVQSLVPDPDGSGYWLVASDGGIFAFDAGFYGSMGDVRLNKPVTGMVGFGAGYLMVGEDGGIFTFGQAPFFGSLGDAPPAHPIVSTAVLDQV